MSTRVGIEREKGNTSASVRNGEACLSLSLCEGPNMARHGEREREGERRRELGLVGEEKLMICLPCSSLTVHAPALELCHGGTDVRTVA